jgi:methylenetetrahydrofolate--tRNA-(uracil-5-)-methyltransferase
MTGVEGYLESAASGFVAGVNASRQARQEQSLIFPSSTAIGALAKYISVGLSSSFQPMNVNFGIIDPLDQKVKGGKTVRNEAISKRALESIQKLDIL